MFGVLARVTVPAWNPISDKTRIGYPATIRNKRRIFGDFQKFGFVQRRTKFLVLERTPFENCTLVHISAQKFPISGTLLFLLM